MPLRFALFTTTAAAAALSTLWADPLHAECVSTQEVDGSRLVDTVTCNTGAPNPVTTPIDMTPFTDTEVVLLPGADLETTADNTPAVQGSTGANTTFTLEMLGDGAVGAVATIETTGANSPGIFMNAAGGNTVSLSFSDADSANPTTVGSILGTAGDNSPVISVDLGVNSSLSLAGEDSVFSTLGNGSPVFDLALGAGSDQLISLQGATLASEGSDANVVALSYGEETIVDFILLETAISALGERSAGVVINGPIGGSSQVSSTLSSVAIETGGTDSAAFMIDGAGDSSNNTTTLFSSSFTTAADRSGGVHIGGLGDGSANEVDVIDVTVETSGADSAGLLYGGAGANSASTVSVEGSSITTRGPNSAAAMLLGALEDSSGGNLNLQSSSFTTDGDGSAGLLVVPLQRAGGGDSIGVATLESLSVATAGDGSAGLILGDAGFLSGGPANAANLSLTARLQDTTVETSGGDSDGVTIYGFGDGATDTDLGALVSNLSVVTEGDRSRGMVLETGLTNAADSESFTVLRGIDVASTGAGGHGLVLGAGLGTDDTGANTTNALRVGDLSVSTSGDGAHALVIGEGATVTIQPAWLGGSLSNGTAVNGLFDSFAGLDATGVGAYSILNQGTLAGGFSADGSLGMDGGLLELSIFGSNTYDRVQVGGSFDVLDGFDLFLDFGSFVPQAGDLFELVVAGAQASSFDPLDAISLSFGGINPTAGLFDLTFDNGVLALAINGQTPPPDIAPIPVPAALPMLLSALGFVALLKVRRRRQMA